MIAAILTALIGAVLGWRFGIFEADWAKQRADDRVYDPLPHWALWSLRLAFALLIAVIVDGPQWSVIWLVAAFMAPLAMLHRISYNRRTRANGLSRTREWYYMGGCRRRIGDSCYDTLCWILSARRIEPRAEEGLKDGGKRCLLIRPRFYAMPCLVAMALECAALACAIALR